MVEAVGREYWPAYLDCLARNLKPGGRAAIQFIAMATTLFEDTPRNADFIQAYVFPGGLLIKSREFRRWRRNAASSWEDQEDFGLDYAETLKVWRARFDAADAQGRLPEVSTRFCDLWRFYLMYCEGGFRGGGIAVTQVTLVKSILSRLPPSRCRRAVRDDCGGDDVGGLEGRRFLAGKGVLPHPRPRRAGIDEVDAQLARVGGLVGVGRSNSRTPPSTRHSRPRRRAARSPPTRSHRPHRPAPTAAASGRTPRSALGQRTRWWRRSWSIPFDRDARPGTANPASRR